MTQPHLKLVTDAPAVKPAGPMRRITSITSAPAQVHSRAMSNRMDWSIRARSGDW